MSITTFCNHQLFCSNVGGVLMNPPLRATSNEDAIQEFTAMSIESPKQYIITPKFRKRKNHLQPMSVKSRMPVRQNSMIMELNQLQSENQAKKSHALMNPISNSQCSTSTSLQNSIQWCPKQIDHLPMQNLQWPKCANSIAHQMTNHNQSMWTWVPGPTLNATRSVLMVVGYL